MPSLIQQTLAQFPITVIATGDLVDSRSLAHHSPKKKYTLSESNVTDLQRYSVHFRVKKCVYPA